MRAQFRFGHVVMSVVSDNYLPLVGLQEAHDVPEAHGLADAAAADDGERLAGIDIKIDIVQILAGRTSYYTCRNSM